jgi:hypothetical protein
MVSSVTMGAKKPRMDSTPPVGRGLGAVQELRSPQEASSSLETAPQGRHGRAGGVGVRHRSAREPLSDFSDTCCQQALMYIWTGCQYTTGGISEKYQIYARQFPALIKIIVSCCTVRWQRPPLSSAPCRCGLQQGVARCRAAWPGMVDEPRGMVPRWHYHKKGMSLYFTFFLYSAYPSSSFTSISSSPSVLRASRNMRTRPIRVP